MCIVLSRDFETLTGNSVALLLQFSWGGKILEARNVEKREIACYLHYSLFSEIWHFSFFSSFFFHSASRFCAIFFLYYIVQKINFDQLVNSFHTTKSIFSKVFIRSKVSNKAISLCTITRVFLLDLYSNCWFSYVGKAFQMHASYSRSSECCSLDFVCFVHCFLYSPSFYFWWGWKKRRGKSIACTFSCLCTLFLSLLNHKCVLGGKRNKNFRLLYTPQMVYFLRFRWNEWAIAGIQARACKLDRFIRTFCACKLGGEWVEELS